MGSEELFLEYRPEQPIQGEVQLFYVKTKTYTFSMNYDSEGEKFYLDYCRSKGAHLSVDLYDVGETIKLEEGMKFHFQVPNEERMVELEVLEPDGTIYKGYDSDGIATDKLEFWLVNNGEGVTDEDENVLSDGLERIDTSSLYWKTIKANEFYSSRKEENSEEEQNSETSSEDSKEEIDSQESIMQSETDTENETVEVSESTVDEVVAKTTEEKEQSSVVSQATIDKHNNKTDKTTLTITIALVLVVAILLAVIVLWLIRKFRYAVSGSVEKNERNREDHTIYKCAHSNTDTIYPFVNPKRCESLKNELSSKGLAPDYNYKKTKFTFLNKYHNMYIYRSCHSSDLLFIGNNQNNKYPPILGFSSKGKGTTILICELTNSNTQYTLSTFSYEKDRMVLIDSLMTYGIISDNDLSLRDLVANCLDYLAKMVENDKLKDTSDKVGKLDKTADDFYRKNSDKILEKLFYLWRCISNENDNVLDFREEDFIPADCKKVSEKQEKTPISPANRKHEENPKTTYVYNNVSTVVEKNIEQKNTTYYREQPKSDLPKSSVHQNEENYLMKSEFEKFFTSSSSVEYCELDYTSQTISSINSVILSVKVFRNPKDECIFCCHGEWLIPNPYSYISENTFKHLSKCFELSEPINRPNLSMKRVLPAKVKKISDNNYELIKKGKLEFE